MQETAHPRNLIYICDGTLSSIHPGEETNAGLLLRLLEESARHDKQTFDYDRGIQGNGWRRWLNAITGNGLNLSLLRGYRFLADHYRPGDRIFLFGYSRGGYAVRSLAGMLGRIGLLRAEYTTRRHIALAFRFYERGHDSTARRMFSRRYCHPDCSIEMLGVWDTVKALGLPYPLLSRLAPMATEFHDHRLGNHIRHGYHALGIDENRAAFRPILWRQSQDWSGRLEQVWFPGAHADVGGDIGGRTEARPLTNIALNWMLERAHRHGVLLPSGWARRFEEDPCAPMVGCSRGLARLFLFRRARWVGGGDGEAIHLSVHTRRRALQSYRPRGTLDMSATAVN